MLTPLSGIKAIAIQAGISGETMLMSHSLSALEGKAMPSGKVVQGKLVWGKLVRVKLVQGKVVQGKVVLGKVEDDIRIQASMCNFYTLQYFRVRGMSLIN